MAVSSLLQVFSLSLEKFQWLIIMSKLLTLCLSLLRSFRCATLMSSLHLMPGSVPLPAPAAAHVHLALSLLLFWTLAVLFYAPSFSVISLAFFTVTW